MSRMPDPRAYGRLCVIGAPTLAIVGDMDMPDLLRTVKQVPGARKVAIPDVAHTINMEELNGLVLQFLSE